MPLKNMKLTNLLLIILICLIGFQKLPLKEVKTVSSHTKHEGIVFGKKTTETKEVKAISTKKDETKFSTTFRQYVDSDSRSTISINQNVRIGKEYYISAGITQRNSDYTGQDYGANISVTKYW